VRHRFQIPPAKKFQIPPERCPSPAPGFVVGVTNTFCGSRAATEEGTMILVNSKDVVADRIRDIQAQAAESGRARQVHAARQPHGGSRPHAARRLTAWAGIRVLARHSG
jgi:hypothetical protein